MVSRKTGKLSARDRQDLARIYRRAGHDDRKLLRWAVECRQPPGAPGRPRDDSITDFSVEPAVFKADEHSRRPSPKGLYVVRFRLKGIAEQCVVIVSPRKRWVRRRGQPLEIMTTLKTFRELAKRRIKGKKLPLGVGNPDSIARRLADRLREEINALPPFTRSSS
jgi:hypothetical protein